MAHYTNPSSAPSVEHMLQTFAEWMAQHTHAQVTVRIDYQGGAHSTSVVDCRSTQENHHE